jgi:hypothetical protein
MENLVAIADAPPTIDDTLQYAFHSAEIYFSVHRLDRHDPTLASPVDGAAFYIGQSKMVGGTTTDMIAFASNDVFVQMWLGAEDKLPRRMRAVYRRDPLKLRHDMEFSNWQLDPGDGDGDIRAVKPSGDAHQVRPSGTKLLARAAGDAQSATAQPTKTPPANQVKR